MGKQSKKIQKAAGLKPVNVQRVIRVGDRAMRLEYDFNAIAEAQIVSGSFEDARAGVKMIREVDVIGADGKLTKQAQRVDFLNVIAEWGYALTATWREDNDDALTYRDFRRLLPVKPEKLTTFIEAVSGVLATEAGGNTSDGEVATGNAPEAPAEAPQ